jgi:hypothetical protein
MLPWPRAAVMCADGYAQEGHTNSVRVAALTTRLRSRARGYASITVTLAWA